MRSRKKGEMELAGLKQCMYSWRSCTPVY